jgi:hypothetical protein
MYDVTGLFQTSFFQHQRLLSDFHIKIQNPEFWFEITQRYHDWLCRQNHSCLTPKNIHQVWIGSSPPSYVIQFSKVCRSLNPDFTYRLWTNDDILDLGLINEAQYLACPNPGAKSDIARYEILNRFGGVYADTDFLPIKPVLPNLMDGNFYAGQVFSYSPEFANGLLISPPNSTILTNTINSIATPPTSLSPLQTLSFSGAYLLTSIIRDAWMSNDMPILLPSQYFYPWPNFMLQCDYNDFITNETVAIHLWHQSWMRVNRKHRCISVIANVLPKVSSVLRKALQKPS